jgi:hypothetical protein
MIWTMMSRYAVRYLVVAILGLFVTGCGGVDYGPTGKITGRLTMDGKPLAAGTAVSFMQMEKGFLAFGLTDADGKFQVDSFNNGDMPAGVYKVMIAPPAAAAPAPKDVSAEEAFENPELLEPTVKAEFPKKYRETATSGLEYDIQAGKNDIKIDLKP